MEEFAEEKKKVETYMEGDHDNSSNLSSTSLCSHSEIYQYCYYFY